MILHAHNTHVTFQRLQSCPFLRRVPRFMLAETVLPSLPVTHRPSSRSYVPTLLTSHAQRLNTNVETRLRADLLVRPYPPMPYGA
jgi:hypothetical protein